MPIMNESSTDKLRLVITRHSGCRVIVGRNESFEVADHDFTKFGIIPSVSVSFPEESWYDGRVFVGMKEVVFEPSSPHRELVDQKLVTEPITVYTVTVGPIIG